MFISLLTILVVIETIIILFGLVIFFGHKSNRLRKTLDALLLEDHSFDVGVMLEDEIERTIQRANQSKGNLDLAETVDIDSASDTEVEHNKTTKLLTFRESYLHAEKFAWESSEGDRDMFWLYLVENLAPLIPEKPKTDASESPAAAFNPILDEILEELQNKLDEANRSNDELQTQLDKFIPEGAKTDEIVSLMRKASSDQMDFSQYASDLDNKIRNALNLDLGSHVSPSANKPGSSTAGKTELVYIEKTGKTINTEVNKLKDIIFEQGNQINNLMSNLKKASKSGEVPEDILDHLKELERSQAESNMCMEILEMENQRLQSEVTKYEEGPGSGTTSNEDVETLKDHIIELQNELEYKELEYQKLQKRCESAEKEIMAIYEKTGKSRPNS